MTIEARILIVDDHELFRQGITKLIDEEPDMVVVGQANDGLEALRLAHELEPDLVLMDIRMPISDGLEATQLILKDRPDTLILMLTVQNEDEYLFSAVKAGAKGYLLKSTDTDSFLAGIRGVLAGEAVLPPKMATRLLDEFARLAAQPLAKAPKEDYGLTYRELEVLELIAKGATDKEIAARLALSIYTVKSHVRNILAKLQAINRWEAARRAGEEGLLNG
jgi:two-component system NarL family response regulator